MRIHKQQLERGLGDATTPTWMGGATGLMIGYGVGRIKPLPPWEEQA